MASTCNHTQYMRNPTPVPGHHILGRRYLLLLATSCSTLISKPELKSIFPFSATVTDEIVQEFVFFARIHITVDIQSTRGLFARFRLVVLAL